MRPPPSSLLLQGKASQQTSPTPSHPSRERERRGVHRMVASKATACESTPKAPADSRLDVSERTARLNPLPDGVFHSQLYVIPPCSIFICPSEALSFRQRLDRLGASFAPRVFEWLSLHFSCGGRSGDHRGAATLSANPRRIPTEKGESTCNVRQ